MSVALVLTSGLAVIETFTGVGVDPADDTITVNQFNETVSLGGATSPAVTKQAAFSKALSTGSATIDLTSLPGVTADETVDGTGLKVQAIKLRNPSTNANKITASKGGSNGYQLDGATTWSLPLAPGQSALLYLDGAADTIGGTKKTIDLAGTGAQALHVQVVMG